MWRWWTWTGGGEEGRGDDWGGSTEHVVVVDLDRWGRGVRGKGGRAGGGEGSEGGVGWGGPFFFPTWTGGEGSWEDGCVNAVFLLQAATGVSPLLPHPTPESSPPSLGASPFPPCRDEVWGAQDLLALAALPVVQRLRNRLSHLLSPSTASGDELPTGGGDAWVKAARSMSTRGERREGSEGGEEGCRQGGSTPG